MAKNPPLVASSDADAIASGAHGDPFAVLGPHRTKAGGVVRSFQPQARRVWVVGAAGDVDMERVHPEGLFAAKVDEPTLAAYRLRVEHADGRLETFDDPYRFPPLLGELDIHLLVEGTHLRTFEKMGSHCATVDGVKGVHFAVWAPNAKRVSVVGDFNGWDGRRHVMRFRHDAGVWELFIPGLGNGTLYKYEIIGAGGFMLPLKADPYGHYAEVPPRTASIVWDLADRQWQ
ncbi:MAG: 1,4-alpha-glucan branching enzyme, partial [Pseudomonadota bacterium]